LEGEGQPRLQANVHQPELAVDKIEVEVLAMTRLGDQFQFFALAIRAHADGMTRLYRGENTD
jgi:hypothetical protein